MLNEGIRKYGFMVRALGMDRVYDAEATRATLAAAEVPSSHFLQRDMNWALARAEAGVILRFGGIFMIVLASVGAVL